MMPLRFMLLLLGMLWRLVNNKRVRFQLLVLGFFCLVIVHVNEALKCHVCPAGNFKQACITNPPAAAECESTFQHPICFIKIAWATSPSAKLTVQTGCMSTEDFNTAEDNVVKIGCEADECNVMNAVNFKVINPACSSASTTSSLPGPSALLLMTTIMTVLVTGLM